MTTHLASICERFPMELREPADGDEWFLNWVLRSPRHSGEHLTAGWHALNALLDVYHPDAIGSVHEYFGGMGAQALMVEELFRPSYHTVADFSTDAAEHMRRALPPFVNVLQEDAYRSDATIADLVVLDFGDLTVWKTREGEPHRQLLDSVFGQNPKAVVLTDIACRYLHLHQTRYETLLGAGTCGSYETYLAALVARLEELYGYSLVAGYWHRWSTVMSFVPTGSLEHIGELHPTPASPVGLELL